MKIQKRDSIREFFIAWVVSILIVTLVPNPFQISPKSTTNNEDSPIHIAIIMKGVGRGLQKCHNLKYQFVTMFRSILQHTSSNLHFILLTDSRSVPYLDKLFRKFIHRDIRLKSKAINITYDFVDTQVITRNYNQAINQMRPHFTSVSKAARKYRDDLFLMGPYYHRIFPYEKLIVLDADLKFRIDIKELFGLFDGFDSSQVMGSANDLSPHYKIAFRKFREANPGTHVGEPGKFQGLNTGVVLYHLGNMRRSGLYNRYVNPEDGYIPTKELAEKYQYASHLGDQCFFTLLSMEYPELFYHLPCSYNYQLDTSLAQPAHWKYFELYHNCTLEAKIYHGNGGSPIPDD